MARRKFVPDTTTDIGGILKQFLIGTVNSYLLDFPLHFAGEERRRMLESQARGERIARGVGTVTGFVTGLPGKILQKGAALGGRAGLRLGKRAVLRAGMRTGTREAIRATRLAEAAGRGAVGFGALEALTAPERNYEEKYVTVPMSIGIGGAIGFAEPLLAPVIRKHATGLSDAMRKTGGYKEVIAKRNALVEDLTKLHNSTIRQFNFHLQQGNIKKANDFLIKNFVGTRKRLAERQLELAQLDALKNHPKIRKLFKNDLFSAWATVNMHKLVPPNYPEIILNSFKNTRRAILEGKAIASMGVYMGTQGTWGRRLAQIGFTVRNISERLAGRGVADVNKILTKLTTNELKQLTKLMHGQLPVKMVSIKVKRSADEILNITQDIARRWQFGTMINGKRVAPFKRIRNREFVAAKENLKSLYEEQMRIRNSLNATQNMRQRNVLRRKQAELVPRIQMARAEVNRTAALPDELATFIPKQGYFFPRMMIGPNTDKHIIEETLRAAVARGEFGRGKGAMNRARAAWDDYVKMMTSKNASGRKNLINWVARRHEVSPIEAEKMLNDFHTHFTKKTFGNLEYARTDLIPFWDPDVKRAMSRYIYGAEVRIANMRAWGQNNEKMLSLINKIATDGHDYKAAEELVARLHGQINERAALGIINANTSATLRSIQTVTKLGLATIPNATQSVNTAIFTNFKTTADTISKMLNKKTRREAYEFALRTGSTLEGAMNEYIRGLGLDGSFTILGKRVSASRFLKKTGFVWMENMNRTIAAHAGKNYAIDMSARYVNSNGTDKLARRALRRLGLNPHRILKNKGLREVDILKAAQTTVNKTQFRAGPLDLPLWFSSPEGKLVSQFKTFAFNQAKFIKDMLKTEVANGNLEPLATAVIAMPILGEGVKNVRGIITGTVRDEKGLNRLLDNISAVGSVGLLTDLWQSATYNNVEGALLGPTFSDMAKLIEGSQRYAKGKPKTLKRFFLRNIPVAGPRLANTFAPSRRQVMIRNRLAREQAAREQAGV